MPLQLFVSNHLVGLKQQLVEHMSQHVPPVFQPYYIVSQTEGMNIWLKYNLATDLGIAAHIKFSKPNDILFEIYMCLGGQFQITINRQSYVWILFDILGSSAFQKRYPEQCSYLLDEDTDIDMKRLQLAEKIADLFDQYQIYRQEFIQEWSLLPPEQAPHWQAYLWSKVISYQKNSDQPLQNINSVRDHILKHIDQPEYRSVLQQRLPVVYLFGLSVFTKYHLEVYYKLAQYVDVQFYLINPSPYVYWGDDKSEKDTALWKVKYGSDHSFIIGNELLTGWGKLIQNTLKLLFQNEDLINAYEPINIHLPEGKNLLHIIQREVFENVSNEDRASVTAALVKDKSIQLHAHYTMQREVEGLYNFLLHQFEEHKGTLLPREILVVCSDINAYAPFIDGVFSNAVLPIKYKIADTAVAVGNQAYTALQLLLQLQDRNFSLESILEILELDIIKTKLQITDIQRVKDVLQLANIRSGIKGEVANQTYTISWWNGIKRLMYGICMSEAPMLTIDGAIFQPLDVMEGNESFAFIRICDFVLDLMKTVQQRNTPRPIHAWVEYVKGLMEQLLLTKEDEMSEALSAFHKLIQEYTEVSTFYQEYISYDLFLANFSQYIEEGSQSSLFYADGVTFCTVVPMRSIPFKVVAMLGLNANKFPRKEKKLSFNLMHQQYQLGDRNIKDSDKHLFLETMLSAGQCFYLSYLGKSTKDNSILNPSSLIDELLAYIQVKLPLEEDARLLLTVEHPLHHFSARYNKDNVDLYYYNSLQGTESSKRIKSNPSFIDEAEVNTTVTIESISRFIAQPIKHYYRKVLGVFLERDDDQMPFFEPFVINDDDGLMKYHVKRRVYESLRQGIDWDSMVLEEQLNSGLPLGNVGKQYAWQYKEELDELVADFFDDSFYQLKQLPLNYESGQFTIQANIEVANGATYDIILSSSVYKHFVGIFLRGLIAAAEGLVTNSHVVYKFTNKKWKLITIDWTLYSKEWIATYFKVLLSEMHRDSPQPLALDIAVWPMLYLHFQEEDQSAYINMDAAWKEAKDEYVVRYLAQREHTEMDDKRALDFFEIVVKPIMDLIK